MTLDVSLRNIREALRQPARYAINGHGLKYILAELLDFFNPASMNKVFRQMLAAGMIPIITHPERHPMLEVRMEPVPVQVTAQSVTGGFGRVAHRTAAGLPQHALVHFIACDRHGADHAISLFITNPRATLAGGR